MSVLSNVIADDSMKNIMKEFSRLGDICYLDNTGAALYPESIIKRVNDDLLHNIYMNPHSDKYSQHCVDEIRSIILKHFNTDPTNYHVIFTSGATQSLKLVMESFQFDNDCFDETKRGTFVHLRDNHTSVLGLREVAKIKNVNIAYISHEDFLESLISNNQLTDSRNDKEEDKGNNLFVYPAQNNFNGFKYPVNQMNQIKNGCLDTYLNVKLRKRKWYILLDAASFASTSKLDLLSTQPDFVCLSFYKIFGFPTGLGALLVKASSVELLHQKKYYGGGTVDIVLNTEDYHAKKQDIYERFEDGTVSFISIAALKHCFEVIHNLIPKVVNNNVMDTVSHHTYYLAKSLYNQLRRLKHDNGHKAVVFYMDSDFTDIEKQGSIVTFNLFKANGDVVGYIEFQESVENYNIRIRTGCFCNSGSCQRHFNLSNEEMKKRYEDGHNCGDEMDIIDGQPTGALRVSFGYYNTLCDVNKIINMINECYVQNNQNKNPIRKVHQNKMLSSANFNNVYIDISNGNAFNKKSDKAGSNITISEIAIYPVKNCGAFKITSSWKITHKGFDYDGAWKIVKDGTLLTQNQIPTMSFIHPVVDLDGNCLTLHFTGMEPVSITLDVSIHCGTKVSNDFDCGDEIAKWLSKVLNVPSLRLIRKCDTQNLVVPKKCNGTSTPSLYDSPKIILINMATIRWLKNHVIDTSMAVDTSCLTDQLRGNIILETTKELVELEWKKVVIGGHEFKVEGRSYNFFTECRKNINIIEPSSKYEPLSGKLFYGLYLSYSGPCTELNCPNLELKSKVKPIFVDEHTQNYKEVWDDAVGVRADLKKTNAKLLKLTKYLWNRGKKYDVTAT